MRVLLVTATETEAGIIRKFFVPDKKTDSYIAGNKSVDLLVTGVGAVATAWALTRWFSTESRPDLAINAGIAGSFMDDIKTGDVVMPVLDCFADSGIETASGFLALYESGLQDPWTYPFTNGKISAVNRYVEQAALKFRPVTAITVNTVTGTAATARKLFLKYYPDIETMEGAAFFYVCSMEKVPYMALRAVSNKVGPRNRGKWDIKLALDNLSVALKDILTTIN